MNINSIKLLYLPVWITSFVKKNLQQKQKQEQMNEIIINKLIMLILIIKNNYAYELDMKDI